MGGEVTSPTIIVQLHADHKVFNVGTLGALRAGAHIKNDTVQ